MKFLLLLFIPFFVAFADFSEVCGKYYGEKDDYSTEIKLYDDSVFQYTATREFPFEVSEGTWILKGDTVILNTTPCTDSAALLHPPIRKYITFTNAKYLYRKNSLIPLNAGKLIKSEALIKGE